MPPPPLPKILEYHGFLLWRHKSKEATCIEYKATDGIQKTIAVKDAKFRNRRQFGVYGLDVSELTKFQVASTSSSWSILGTSAFPQTEPIPDTYTNEAIFQNWSASLVSDKTAKENCDIWMKYNTYTDSQGIVGVPAVAYCRSQTLDGISCNLPNIYQTIIIWTCGDKLDELDPTISSYSSMRLGYSTTYGSRINQLWSSTDYLSTRVRAVHSNGNCINGYKHYNYTIVPILELEN